MHVILLRARAAREGGSVACARPVIDSQISHSPALIGPEEPGAVYFCKTNNRLQVEVEARVFFYNRLIYVFFGRSIVSVSVNMIKKILPTAALSQD